MNAGILEAVKPFIDYHAEVDGVDYRKTIFIFIRYALFIFYFPILEQFFYFSNTAGNDISEKALDHWKQGKAREALTLAEMEQVIHVAAYNEPGWLGWWIRHAVNALQRIGAYLGSEERHQG